MWGAKGSEEWVNVRDKLCAGWKRWMNVRGDRDEWMWEVKGMNECEVWGMNEYEGWQSVRYEWIRNRGLEECSNVGDKKMWGVRWRGQREEWVNIRIEGVTESARDEWIWGRGQRSEWMSEGWMNVRDKKCEGWEGWNNLRGKRIEWVNHLFAEGPLIPSHADLPWVQI
jgi:hypothetical protein